jgi:hypothetical protein
MVGSSVQETAVKEPQKEEAAQPDETSETIEVSLDSGRTVKVTQATVPTGIFPMPGFLRRLTGSS